MRHLPLTNDQPGCCEVTATNAVAYAYAHTRRQQILRKTADFSAEKGLFSKNKKSDGRKSAERGNDGLARLPSLPVENEAARHAVWSCTDTDRL